MTIRIEKSPTADTRTCDFRAVTPKVLLDSSRQHIEDVQQGHAFFVERLLAASRAHDRDKLTDIEGFHRDFLTGFAQTDWWDRHRQLNRHHLGQEDGVPEDVNLVDVLDYIVDCVMSGMARSGSVYELKLLPGLLEKAFHNTVDLLTKEVEVK